jgi:hypothetical protein
MELVCTQSCNKYAKYRFQELKQVKIYDKSNRKYIQIYEVVKPSKKCTECGKVTPIAELIDNQCMMCADIPEGVMA